MLAWMHLSRQRGLLAERKADVAHRLAGGTLDEVSVTAEEFERRG
jgi:hypothetical protein